MKSRRKLLRSALGLVLGLGMIILPDLSRGQAGTTFELETLTGVTVMITYNPQLNFGTITAPLTTPSQTFTISPTSRTGVLIPGAGDGFFAGGHQLGTLHVVTISGQTIIVTVTSPPPDVTCTAKSSGSLTGTVLLTAILMEPCETTPCPSGFICSCGVEDFRVSVGGTVEIHNDAFGEFECLYRIEVSTP